MQLISFIYPSICCLVTQWQKALYHLHGWAFSLLWSSATYVCPASVTSAWGAVTEYMPSVNTRARRVPTQTSYSIHGCWTAFKTYQPRSRENTELSFFWLLWADNFQVFSSGIDWGQSIKSPEANGGIQLLATWLTDQTPVPQALRCEPRQRQEARVRSVTWESNMWIQSLSGLILWQMLHWHAAFGQSD